MKKIILLALTALMMMGCDERMPDGTYRVSSGTYRVYIMDSYEYLGILNNGNGNFIAHKGNCRFCQEHRQKELKELVKQLKENKLWQQLIWKQNISLISGVSTN